MTTTSVPAGRRTRAARLYHGIMRHWQLYLLMLLPIIWVIMFRYVPIWGSQIAFKDYKLALGVEGSPWAEPIYKHFLKFFKSNQFSRLMINTIGLSLYNILAGIFPPIILAIALNYCSSRFFSKTVQLVTYMPYFISTVLVVSILTQMLSLSGAVNKLIVAMGGTPIQFLSKPEWFKTLYVFSELWQKTGYNAVVYIAALVVSCMFIAFFIGSLLWRKALKKAPKLWAELLIGTAAWTLVSCIPVVSFLAGLVGVPFGLGMVTLLITGAKARKVPEVPELPESTEE